MSFHFNGEEVRAFLAPPAHTDGDTFVYFPESDVLHLGDVFRTTSYPLIDVYNGGPSPARSRRWNWRSRWRGRTPG